MDLIQQRLKSNKEIEPGVILMTVLTDKKKWKEDNVGCDLDETLRGVRSVVKRTKTICCL